MFMAGCLLFVAKAGRVRGQFRWCDGHSTSCTSGFSTPSARHTALRLQLLGAEGAMDDGRFEQDHSRGGHVEGPANHKKRSWLADDSRPSNSGRGERGTPRGREEVPEWDSGSGV